MNIERAKELWPVIKAFAEGKDVQRRLTDEETWATKVDPSFDPIFIWRVKPEPRDFVVILGECGSRIRDVRWFNPDDDVPERSGTLEVIKVREVIDE